MVALLQDLARDDHPATPAVVLSNHADTGGLDKAKALGVATEFVSHKEFPGDREGFEAGMLAALRPYDVDTVCLAGFMRILTPRFIGAYPGRMLNIHPSLLPKHKGLNTHAAALQAGDTEHGCTVHLVTPELDDGPILGQARVPVLPDDTPDSLAARVLKKEHQLYPAVLRRFVNGDRTPIVL